MALRVSIGQYYSANSPIHRIDPRVKIVATVVYMVSCFFVFDAPTLALAAAAVLAAVLAARVPFGRLAAQTKPVALFLIITSVFNLFFVQTGDLALAAGPIRVYTDGISAAVLYTTRFFLLLMAGGLLMLTTTPTALCDACERLLKPLERLGVPVTQAALVMSIALRFVPTLAQEADNIIAAQTARGADLEGKSALAYARACVPLIVPLFASALRHADNLGHAMDARCYTGGRGRTHYHTMAFQPKRDLPLVACLALYLATLTALHLI